MITIEAKYHWKCLAAYYNKAALQINIIALSVTMNRKIKKTLLKLIFGSHNKTTNNTSLTMFSM